MTITPFRSGVLVPLVAAALLAGCMGVDVSSVRRVEPGAALPTAGEAVVIGRIEHRVDGRPMTYGLLDKPHLSLVHLQRGVSMSSPETQADGSYRWQLPAGDYVVAVIFGGMSPTRQPLALPSGSVIHVNGIVHPGLAIRVPAGGVADLGTLVIDVESAPGRGLFAGDGRVFGRLAGVRVEPPADATYAMRRIGEPRPTASPSAAPFQPAVLAPVLPALIR